MEIGEKETKKGGEGDRKRELGEIEDKETKKGEKWGEEDQKRREGATSSDLTY